MNVKSLISHPSSVKRVVLGEGVVSIDYWTFYKCIYLISIFIPEGVTFIAGTSFAYCSRLMSVHIPESVTVIGAG